MLRVNFLNRSGWIALLCASCLWVLTPSVSHAQEATADYRKPVQSVASARLAVTVGEAKGVVPIEMSVDWDKPQPDIKRALVVFHGRLRNAGEYYSGARETIVAAGTPGQGTALFVPQFLAQRDIKAHQLGPEMIHWQLSEWMGGNDAQATPISSFDVIDAVLAHLGDRHTFPNLDTVVLAGHSGGGQLVQRYAAVAKGDAALVSAGIKIKWIVSNPSTYLYFNTDRPTADGRFAPYVSSPGDLFNTWKYGLEKPPRYVSGAAEKLEQAYISRDVTYLLGAADNDPNLEALDKSAAAQTQGDNHLSRGLNYVHYMQFRHPGLSHRLLIVPGIGHDANKIFGSAFGLSVLFDVPDVNH